MPSPRHHPFQTKQPEFNQLRCIDFFRHPAGYWINIKALRMPIQSRSVHVERRT